MTIYVALLRAVNVGGTSKLAMADLRALAGELGLVDPRTYIASGNLIFGSEWSETIAQQRIEEGLAKLMGKHVPVVIRSGEELNEVVQNNPFEDAPGRRLLITFLNHPPPADALDKARGHDGERVALGKREIYVDYCGSLLGRSKLTIPAAAAGTARNMNTVRKLAEMAKEHQ